MSERSIVLLSGGLDSAVNLAWAAENTEIALALTFDYGQRAAGREIESASRLAEHYSAPWLSLKLDWLREITATALVRRDLKLPELSLQELDDSACKARDSAAAVWVPNRNGLFINIAACYAEKEKASLIIAGLNSEEGATFPDHTPEFVEAINNSLKHSTLEKTRVFSCTMALTKEQIFSLAIKHKLPLNLLWSCYEGGKKQCGRCESCLRLKRAAAAAGTLPEGGLDFAY
ncbi:MAG: 7-cyano-7-deazaguanine synthase QueC [Desulfobacterales bacterium]|nr:7-cyano-7-deazaguanine synthase QueC [Desulfobacterales bacterium]